jgi:hypothetical protein
MVSLAVTSSSGPPATQRNSLRGSALWYPQIPAIDMDLNEHHFPTKDICISKFLPLCYLIFDGPKGARLQNLTGISTMPYASPPGIKFFYNENSVPGESYRPRRDVIGRWYELGGLGGPENVDRVFHIDGSGGEAIDSITTFSKHFLGDQVPWFFKGGVLESIKVWLFLFVNGCLN